MRVVLILVIAFAVVSLMAFLVNPIVVSYSSAKIHAMTLRAVNVAIGEVLNPATFSQLSVVERDPTGRITNIQTDTFQMNEISGKVALKSKDKFDEFTAAKLGVPVGTFTGLPIFSGRGFDVPIRVVPVGAMYCTFSTDFVSAGINQTIHRIVLTTKTTMNLVMPTGSRNLDVEIDILLCENLIVGEVPEFYWGR